MTRDGESKSVRGSLGNVARAGVWKAIDLLGDRPSTEKSAESKGESTPVEDKHDADLRAYGARLIAMSQKPDYEAGGRHPAFTHILDQLHPDEARIVRFLGKAGVQPAIDIRTKTLFQIGSERLAAGINLIAEMSSCRWPDRDQHYLVNLERLGIVRFSTEPVEDFRRYSLLEVQPRAMAAIESVKSAISIYRSIELSEFGRQFCDACFDMTGYTAGGWDKHERGDRTIGSGPPKPKLHKH
ncbi:Abi-alpha family protein [Antrihabitans stalactiti]|uniref:DUF4393 domain-containing protein n=1 Tax=Antrihabitans stalactiti TaxID=2584121 RepID=A0A848K3M5_9NOCA|nr:Abi-alpha family protein [Antrihabitans stalactiti]NMN93745.1 DUF4393 domain-containing protein [Antrihabitans stalactiti]